MGQQLLTKHNYDFYCVASAFQKSIRRGIEDDAMYWAAELYDSNYRDYAWKRIIVMASEDVGLGEPSCIVQIMALKQAYEEFKRMKDYGAMKLPYVQAVLCLVRSRKSRYCDHAITVYWSKIETERKEFPDYVYDKHTYRGKYELKRGLEHFYSDASLICNANKLKGEEELESIARKVDGVWRDFDREDIPVNDESYMAIRRKIGDDDSPTLF